MIALITGAYGFIGTHLTRYLLENGYEVRCVDIASPPHDWPGERSPVHYSLDLSNQKAIEETAALKGIDLLFHLAGGTKLTGLKEFRAWNVIPTRNLLQAVIKRRQNLKRFIYISSLAAVGPALSLENPVDDDVNPRPVGHYGISKWEGEQEVSRSGGQVPFTIIRPSAVYGPRDVDFLQVFKTIKFHLSIYPGYRHKYLTPVYVEDLVRGMVQAAISSKSTGKAYFLGSDQHVTWEFVYRKIAALMEKKVLEISIPQKLVDLMGVAGNLYTRLTGRFTLVNTQKINLSRPTYWICSSQGARRDFDYNPEILLEQGLRATYQWYRTEGWL
jgi:nucleoside-diphosphate-sugar epimerase